MLTIDVFFTKPAHFESLVYINNLNQPTIALNNNLQICLKKLSMYSHTNHQNLHELLQDIVDESKRVENSTAIQVFIALIVHCYMVVIL